MRTFIIALVIILLVVGAALGGFVYLQAHGGSLPSLSPSTSSSSSGANLTQTITAQRGNLSAALTVVGSLESVQSQTVQFEKIAGSTKLDKLDVATGAQVKAGDVLASIDPAPYQQALDQAKSDLQAAEQTLTDLNAPPTEVQFAQADLTISQAQYQLEVAKSTLDDLLHPDLEQLDKNVADAKTSLVKAQADLLTQQQSARDTTNLEKMQDAEGKATAEYNRLAAETYSDAKTQDRLLIAYNKMMTAKEVRIAAETQTKISLLNAQMSVRKAEQNVAKAQKVLADAQKGGDVLEKARAERAVKDAEVALAVAKDNRAELDKGPDATKLAAARADRDKKQLAVADTEAALAATELKAPFDGTVLQVNLNQGDLVANNVKVLTLANLGQLQVLASVDETTVRSVQKGQKAQVSFDALPGQILNGLVGDVPLQGILQGGVTVYEVPVSLQGADKLPLLVGMTANVKIATGEAQNVVLVPTMALTKANGMYQVLVADPVNPTAQPQAVPVQVGLSDGTYTQITAGLNEGDQVIVKMSTTTGTVNQQRNIRIGGGMLGIGIGR